MTLYDERAELLQMGEIVLGLRKFLTDYGYTREDFRETPERVAKMWFGFLNGSSACQMKHFPTVSSGGIICIKDFTMWSFCPHHLLPVRYEMKIGYIPNDRALGLSKLGRAARCLATMMPLQEDVARLTADSIREACSPLGIGIIVQGQHLCMQMRGIEDPCVCAASDHYEGKMLEESYQRRFISL